MNRDAIILHKKKKDAWNHYKRTKDKHDYIRANQLKNDLSKLTRNLCREFEKYLARNMKTNPRAFWRYCNTKLKTKPRIGDLVDSEGQPTHEDLEKADILNKYFASVFMREDLASMPTLDNKHEDPQLRDIIIDEEIVKKKLLKLNSTKSAGPGGFHPRVLAETAGLIAKPLSIIFRKSLDEGNLPMDWKVATVIPIHKKGNKKQPGNYRPVSLTSVVGKLMESIVRDNIVDHMMENTLFVDRISWDKVDISLYKELTASHLRSAQCCAGPDALPEILIDRINKILHEAAICSSSQRSGRKNKGKKKHHIDPILIPAIQNSKAAFWEWKNANRPGGGHDPTYVKMLEKKKQLRQAQRQLEAEKRTQRLVDIMEANPTNQSLFYRLVRGQRKTDSTTVMTFDGTSLSGSDLHQAWTSYFEKLATPTDCPEYDKEHKASVELKNVILEDRYEASRHITLCPSVNKDNVSEMIGDLKNNKAPDMWGICSEHLKHADPVLLEMLTTLINQVLRRRQIPPDLKRGVITPVYKGKGDKSLPDSYRRITVTSLVGKLIEKTLVRPTKDILQPKLNRLQRGFCSGSSSVNTAVLVTEACAEAQDAKAPLYATFLDASKAFDVVWHQGLFLKLMQLGITDDLWMLYRDLYNGMSSAMKWEGEYCTEFNETQGVRQGGIPSTELFKVRGDSLLHRIEKSLLGFSVGTVDLSVPTCADDMILLSSSPIDLQAMINIAAADASWERYKFSSTKTKAFVSKARARSDQHIENCWSLGGTQLETTTEETHLGIVRTSDTKTTETVRNNITKSRRALYALLSSGMHGLNGVHPKVSLKLWNSYILPRLTYGLQQMVCSKKDLELIERFQRSTFRRLQHLPERTSNSVTLLILGELPVQATIDKQTLTFFSSILTDPNSKEHLLVHRQLAVKDPYSNSWVMHVARLLRQYDLPSPHHLLTNPPGRTSTGWKMQVKEAIRSYWMKELIQDVGHKITARFLSKDSLKCGILHPLWNLTPFHLYDIRQACIKAKMLAGVYWLGADELKNKKGVSSICPFCKMETEDPPISYIPDFLHPISQIFYPPISHIPYFTVN